MVINGCQGLSISYQWLSVIIEGYVFPGLLKPRFCSGKVALVIKPAFLRSMYESKHSEAQKPSFLDT